MSSSIHAFLTQPRSQRRVLSVALGLAFIGIAFGLEHQFSNWGVVAFLMVGGAALLLSGLFFSDHHLAKFFIVCVALNMVAAGYAFIFGAHVQP
jgi:hypothetical protein